MELKFKNPSLINQFPLFRMGGTGYVEAPEVSKKYGDCADWKNAVGTGPWILKEYIEGSTLNFIKNPNYWGHDERYPDNRLPYADKLTVICIQDEATAMAALRTGKIDILKGVHWKKAETLKKSNPALKQALLSEPGNGILLNLFNKPFTDVKVRKALNMAFNRELIAKVHYGGLIEGKPCGIISSLLADYSTPFEEWPKDLQEGYIFNPEAARKLLAEAGYPNGFSTSCVTSSSHDLELLQILKSMFSDIGVDVEIQSMDRATYTNITMTGKHKGMAGPEPQGFNVIGTPWENLQMRTSNAPNPSTFKDPVYDSMCAEFNNILDPAKLAQQVKDADRYIMERYTSVLVLPNIDYNIWQPYLKGYSGERLNNMGYYARWWIGDK